jgi:steroid delta-isomerase-like uncharacterized protein
VAARFPYRRYVDDVWNAHDLDALPKYFAPDVRVHSLSPGIDPGVGVPYLRDLASSFFKAFPDVKVVVEDVIQEGDRVAARATLEGTQAAEFAGVSSTGRRMKIYDFVMYRVASGKIVEVWSLVDIQGLRDQLLSPAR